MARLAPVIVGTPTTAASSGASLSLPVPSGATSGDVLVAALRSQAANSGTDWAASGWTRIGPSFVASTADGRVMGLYALRVTGTPPASVAFTVGASGRVVGAMVIVRGVDPTTLTAGQSPTYAGTILTRGRRAEGYSISDACLQLSIGANENTGSNSSTPTTTPSGHTLVQRVDTGTSLPSSRTSVEIWQRTWSGAGTTADADFAWAAASGQGAQSVALLGAEEPEPDPAPERDGEASLTLDASSVVRVDRAPVNVTSVLATPGWTMAHRGNGTGGNTGEHTAFAYRQAVNRGYPVLEMSLARTSDGVWFGLHDQYLDRTSGVSGNVDPTTMTWATLTANYQITNGADGIVRPYYRLDDLIADYGDTHVLMLDPKHRHSSHRSEFLDICEQLGPERCIVKFYYSESSLATAAAARGLKSWGYCYEADLTDPQLNTRLAPWTLLGLEYSASPGAWTTIKSYGKPVIGHIAASQADYNTAISKGADAVQCGASQLIAAVGPAGESYARTGTAGIVLTATAVGQADGGEHERGAAAGLSLAASAVGIADGGEKVVTGSAGLTLTASATAVADGGEHVRTGVAGLTLAGLGYVETDGGTVTRSGTAGLTLTATGTATVHGGEHVRVGVASLDLIATAATETASEILRGGIASLVLTATATATADGGTVETTGTAHLRLAAVGYITADDTGPLGPIRWLVDPWTLDLAGPAPLTLSMEDA